MSIPLKSIGEVTDVLDNLRKPINNMEREARIKGKKDLIPYYGATGQVGWIDDYLTNEELVLIGEDGAPFLDRFKPKAYIIKGRAWVNNHVHIIKGKANIAENRFLMHYLNSFNYSSYVNGTTRLKLTKGKLLEIPVPLPPLPVQQAIVAKLEALFSELDKGIEQLKTAQQQLRTYRQALLKAAFEGRLTGEKVKNGELPEGWKCRLIGEISTNVEYGSAAKSKEAGRIPVLRMGNIQNSKFVWDDLVFTDDIEEIKKYALHKGDVLFNRTNSTELVGKTAIYKGERQAIFAGYLIRINYIKDQVLGDYLNYYLNTTAAREYGNQVKSFGVNQSNINGTKLKSYRIPLAPIEKQASIVSAIESRLSVTDKLEETIVENLRQAEALRQSILKKAFEGELVS